MSRGSSNYYTPNVKPVEPARVSLLSFFTSANKEGQSGGKVSLKLTTATLAPSIISTKICLRNQHENATPLWQHYSPPATLYYNEKKNSIQPFHKQSLHDSASFTQAYPNVSSKKESVNTGDHLTKMNKYLGDHHIPNEQTEVTKKISINENKKYFMSRVDERFKFPSLLFRNEPYINSIHPKNSANPGQLPSYTGEYNSYENRPNSPSLAMGLGKLGDNVMQPILGEAECAEMNNKEGSGSWSGWRPSYRVKDHIKLESRKQYEKGFGTGILVGLKMDAEDKYKMSNSLRNQLISGGGGIYGLESLGYSIITNTQRKIERERCKTFIRSFIKYSFSHVGICILVVVYILMGAFAFRALEYPNESMLFVDVYQLRLDSAEKIWKISKKLNPSNRHVYTSAVSKELLSYQMQIIKLVQRNFNGTHIRSDDFRPRWSLNDAFLYSLTVITTIGYGNMTPKTIWGKIVTVIYAIFGIPILLLYLTNIGGFLAHLFKFLYFRTLIMCSGTNRARKRKANIRVREISEMISESESIPLRTEKNKKSFSKFNNSLDFYSQPLLISPNTLLKCQSSSEDTNQISDKRKKKGKNKGKGLTGDSEATSSYLKSSRRSHTPSRESYNPMILENEIQSILIGQHKKIRNSKIGKYHKKDTKATSLKYNKQDEVHDLTLINIPSENRAKCLSIYKPNCRNNSVFAQDLLSSNVNNFNSLLAEARSSKNSALIDWLNTNDEQISNSNDTPYVSKKRKDKAHRSIRDLVVMKGRRSTATLKRSKSLPSAPNLHRNKHGGFGIGPRSYSKITVPMWLSISVLILYVLAGTILFSTWEEWDYIDGSYFCFITLSTIGFGDLVPGDKVMGEYEKDAMQKLAITSLYILTGMAIIAMCFNLMQEQVIESVKKFGVRMGIVVIEETD